MRIGWLVMTSSMMTSSTMQLCKTRQYRHLHLRKLDCLRSHRIHRVDFRHISRRWTMIWTVICLQSIINWRLASNLGPEYQKSQHRQLLSMHHLFYFELHSKCWTLSVWFRVIFTVSSQFLHAFPHYTYYFPWLYFSPSE